jgi:hypothetical protein
MKDRNHFSFTPGFSPVMSVRGKGWNRFNGLPVLFVELAENGSCGWSQ